MLFELLEGLSLLLVLDIDGLLLLLDPGDPLLHGLLSIILFLLQPLLVSFDGL